MTLATDVKFDLTPPSDAQRHELESDLSDEERHVLLEHGTEAPFCGIFLSEKRPGTYTCRLVRNGVAGAWSACNGGTVTFTGLTDAGYQFQVRGRTPTGVQDTTPATRSFTVRVG